MKQDNLYEDFHSKTSAQNKTISAKNFTYRLLIESLDKYIRPGMKILDIGCGAGTLSLYLANKNYDVLGIDISKGAIQSAQSSASILNFKKARFKVMNFPEEYPKEKFDFIVLTEVIEHIEG